MTIEATVFEIALVAVAVFHRQLALAAELMFEDLAIISNLTRIQGVMRMVRCLRHEGDDRENHDHQHGCELKPSS